MCPRARAHSGREPSCPKVLPGDDGVSGIDSGPGGSTVKYCLSMKKLCCLQKNMFSSASYLAPLVHSLRAGRELSEPELTTRKKLPSHVLVLGLLHDPMAVALWPLPNEEKSGSRTRGARRLVPYSSGSIGINLEYRSERHKRSQL